MFNILADFLASFFFSLSSEVVSTPTPRNDPEFPLSHKSPSSSRYSILLWFIPINLADTADLLETSNAPLLTSNLG